MDGDDDDRRRRPPSHLQLEVLGGFGLRSDKGLSRDQASVLIGCLIERQRNFLTTPEQIAKLVSMGWEVGDARDMNMFKAQSLPMPRPNPGDGLPATEDFELPWGVLGGRKLGDVTQTLGGIMELEKLADDDKLDPEVRKAVRIHRDRVMDVILTAMTGNTKEERFLDEWY